MGTIKSTHTGKVKFFQEAKGYGFITGEDGKDVFFHFSNSLDRVKKDEEVAYDIEEGQRGPKAVNVHRIKAKDGNK